MSLSKAYLKELTNTN